MGWMSIVITVVCVIITSIVSGTGYLEARRASVGNLDLFDSDDKLFVDEDDGEALEASTSVSLEFFRNTLTVVDGFLLLCLR